MPRFMLYAHSNTASDNMVRCEWKVHQKLGIKESRISSIYTSNFETSRNVSMRHGCPRGDCKVRVWDLLRIA